MSIFPVMVQTAFLQLRSLEFSLTLEYNIITLEYNYHLS